jgi:hypothetical protein
MRTILVLLTVAAAIGYGLGDWVWEQVDGDTVSLNIGAAAQVGPDSVIHVSYGSSNSTFYHAWKDTIWHRETTLTAPATSQMFRLAVGPHGEVGVLFRVLLGDGRVLLMDRGDSGWAMDTVPYVCVGGYCLAYDTAGTPCLAINGSVMLRYAERHDTTWTSVSLAGFSPPYTQLTGPAGLVFDSFNRPYTCWRGGYYYHTLHEWLEYAYRGQTGEWFTVSVQSGYVAVTLLDFDARDTGQVAVCYNKAGAFYYNDEVLEPFEVAWARVKLDSAGRPHVIYPSWNVVVHKFKYEGTWYFDTVMTYGEATVGNLCYSPSGELVLCVVRDNSPWIARRSLPQVAVTENETPRGELDQPRVPTIVRGVLLMPAVGVERRAPGILLDISGRKVLNLKPGSNDVRALAPGVYFVRGEGRGAGDEGRMRKVVIAR